MNSLKNAKHCGDVMDKIDVPEQNALLNQKLVFIKQTKISQNIYQLKDPCRYLIKCTH